MALSDLSFKMYVDSGLTTAYAGVTSIVHNTDLSDNPQDFVLYFGSAATSRVLQAASSPGVDTIYITPTDVLPAWATATAYTLGLRVEPTTPNTYAYEVTTAGTSHASTEPTWPTTIGNTVTDGTVTWTCISKKHVTTEIRLAITSGGLSSATAGAALGIGTSISSGSANAIPIHFRITNTVTTPGNTTGTPELALYITNSVETAV
jgi:hypothetical protein